MHTEETISPGMPREEGTVRLSVSLPEDTEVVECWKA